MTQHERCPFWSSLADAISVDNWELLTDGTVEGARICSYSNAEQGNIACVVTFSIVSMATIKTFVKITTLSYYVCMNSISEPGGPMVQWQCVSALLFGQCIPRMLVLC